MNDKIVAVAESAFGFAPCVVSENSRVFEEDIKSLSESQRKLIGFTAEKVIVNSDGIDSFVEYTENLERYMKDSGKSLNEAVEDICKQNDLLSESIVIVVDESCVDKLDMTALKENYNVKRK